MRENMIYKFSENGTIHGYKWYDENTSIKGIIVLIHGMAEHIERYDDFANYLAKNGYLVFGNNQRGHKDTSSKENYGYMSDNDNLEILVSDVYELIKTITSKYPNLPIYLFSHSMGSFVTQRYIELHGNTIEGVILCGSAKQPKMLIMFGHAISSMICAFKGRKYRSKLFNDLSFGNYNKHFKPNRSINDWLNRNEDEVDKYDDDEYCGGIFTISYFKDFMNHMKITNKEFGLIPKNLPIYLISGADDPVGGYSKYTKALYKELKEKQKIKDVTLSLYEGARHEILLELNKEEVYKDCLDFYNRINN